MDNLFRIKVLLQPFTLIIVTKIEDNNNVVVNNSFYNIINNEYSLSKNTQSSTFYKWHVIAVVIRQKYRTYFYKISRLKIFRN